MQKILILDDEVDLLNMIKLLLGRRNYDVCGLSNCAEMDAAIKVFKPQLIILDISLGSADGRVLCKQLKQDKVTAHILVLLCSGNSKVKHSLAEFLPDGFIEKPFLIDDLVKEIKNILPLAI